MFRVAYSVELVFLTASRSRWARFRISSELSVFWADEPRLLNSVSASFMSTPALRIRVVSVVGVLFDWSSLSNEARMLL